MLTPLPERVLVKEVNWLGDVVMSLPALKAVRRAWPQTQLAVLVKRELAAFFDGSGWIDDVIPYTVARGLQGIADRWHIVTQIRARRFDLAILFPKSFEAALWAMLARVPRRAGLVTDARGPLLTDKVALTGEAVEGHQARQYAYLLRQTVGIDMRGDDNQPDVHEPHRATMRTWLGERRRRPHAPLVALAPGAAFGPAKEWPAEHYAALIDVLAQHHGVECVLVGSAAERNKCAEVVAASQHGALIAAGETNLGELVALLSLCDAFAGNDSGSMHVAGAVGIPTVGLFGSTNPQRTGPRGPKTTVLYRRIECSPCLQRTCRFGHYDCLKQIAAEEVVAALQSLGALGQA
jgi:lipopolysaccharide heptosyltransferase II